MDTAKVKKYLPIVLVVVLVIATYSTASALLSTRSTSAQNRPQPVPAAPQAAPAARPQPAGGDCNGLTCNGFYNGTPGNHITGGGGDGGNFSGYPQVRFDAFSPHPDYIRCAPVAGRDGPILRQLGQSGSDAPTFVHHRVAILRSDNVTVVNGVPGQGNWDSGEDFNLVTGARRPSSNLGRAPTKSDPWIGPNWLGREYCLPLSGGQPIEDELTEYEPEVQLVHSGNDVCHAQLHVEGTAPEDLCRLLLGMKGLKLRFTLYESTLSGPVSINFDLQNYSIKVADANAFFERLLNPESENRIWFDSTEADSPISVSNLKQVDSGEIAPGRNRTVYEVDVHIKKPGFLVIMVDAGYNATTPGNDAPFTGLAASSQMAWMNAIAAKSVNR